MEETRVNFITKKWVKNEFFRICKDQNVNASARFNDFMRKEIQEYEKSNSQKVTKRGNPIDTWRDELVRRG